RAGGWRTGRDQKSPLRRCFKPRPSWRTRCAGFASGCQSSVRSCKRPQSLCLETSRQFDKLSVRHAVLAISLRAAVRPLVRMPTDRHTATGTCEFGQYANKWILPRAQEKFARSAKVFSPSAREGFEKLKNRASESRARPRAALARRQPLVVNGSIR